MKIEYKVIAATTDTLDARVIASFEHKHEAENYVRRIKNIQGAYLYCDHIDDEYIELFYLDYANEYEPRLVFIAEEVVKSGQK